jgi:hypothetical protein
MTTHPEVSVCQAIHLFSTVSINQQAVAAKKPFSD